MQLKYYIGQKTRFAHAIKFKQHKFDGLDEEVSNTSHVEAFFEDGIMYGASEVDGGVRDKYMREFKNHWETVELGLTKTEEKFCRNYLESKLGLEYDISGIVWAQVLGTNWFLRKNKYFCSELIVEMLQELLKSGLCTFETFERLRPVIGVAPHMVTPAALRLMTQDV